MEGSQKIKECREMVGSSPLKRGSYRAPVLSEVRSGLALGIIVTHSQNCVPQWGCRGKEGQVQSLQKMFALEMV